MHIYIVQDIHIKKQIEYTKAQCYNSNQERIAEQYYIALYVN